MKQTIIKERERKKLREGKSMNERTEKGRKKGCRKSMMCNDECAGALWDCWQVL